VVADDLGQPDAPRPLEGTPSQQIRAVIGWWARPRMCVVPGWVV
jgi:hypothetical protein